MLPVSVSLYHFDILVSVTRKKSRGIGFSEMKMPGRREGDEHILSNPLNGLLLCVNSFIFVSDQLSFIWGLFYFNVVRMDSIKKQTDRIGHSASV